jgi:antitoxin CptB
MLNPINPARVRWGCRRGMLELDILLLPFFETKFQGLNLKQQTDFVRLLECTDPELYAWLMGHERPTEPEFESLVQQIKHHAWAQV